MPRSKHEESSIQVSCIDYCKLHNVMAVGSQNGTMIAGNPRQRAMRSVILQKEGMVTGYPDIQVFLQGQRSFFVELKIPKIEKTATTKTKYAGKQSKSQMVVEKCLDFAGFDYYIAHSLEEFIAILDVYSDLQKAGDGWWLNTEQKETLHSLT